MKPARWPNARPEAGRLLHVEPRAGRFSDAHVADLPSLLRAGDLLVIAEVRTRASDRYGGAAASIGPAKQRRIAATAGLLLQRHPELRRCRVRFDVLVVRDGRVEWLKHAFDAWHRPV